MALLLPLPLPLRTHSHRCHRLHLHKFLQWVLFSLRDRTVLLRLLQQRRQLLLVIFHLSRTPYPRQLLPQPPPFRLLIDEHLIVQKAMTQRPVKFVDLFKC